MKNRDMIDALNDIDFDLIEDAGRVTRKTSMRRKIARWSSFAACVCLALALIPVLFKPSSPPEEGTPPSSPYMENPPVQDATPPPYMYPFGYVTFDEFKNAISEKNEKTLYAELLEQGAGDGRTDVFKSFVRKFRAQHMMIPCIDGETVELSNREGFSNISFFASEAYNLPWIFYYPYVSTGENFYIKITYVPDYILGQMENPTASEVIRALSPNSPNVGNLGERYEKIYNKTIKLYDREVTAMVCEYKDDPRNSTIFMYGDLLVEVKGKPDVWTAQWFSSLSFDSFYQ